VAGRCLLLGVDRTYFASGATSAFDPKRTSDRVDNAKNCLAGVTASGQDFEMKRCAFISLGDDMPPAARVQQPAAELRLPVASVGRRQGLASAGAERLQLLLIFSSLAKLP
jgi:hypothetical protein